MNDNEQNRIRRRKEPNHAPKHNKNVQFEEMR